MPVVGDDVICLRRNGAVREFVVVRIGDDGLEAEMGLQIQDIIVKS